MRYAASFSRIFVFDSATGSQNGQAFIVDRKSAYFMRRSIAEKRTADRVSSPITRSLKQSEMIEGKVSGGDCLCVAVQTGTEPDPEVCEAYFRDAHPLGRIELLSLDDLAASSEDGKEFCILQSRVEGNRLADDRHGCRLGADLLEQFSFGDFLPMFLFRFRCSTGQFQHHFIGGKAELIDQIDGAMIGEREDDVRIQAWSDDTEDGNDFAVRHFEVSFDDSFAVFEGAIIDDSFREENRRLRSIVRAVHIVPFDIGLLLVSGLTVSQE